GERCVSAVAQVRSPAARREWHWNPDDYAIHGGGADAPANVRGGRLRRIAGQPGGSGRRRDRRRSGERRREGSRQSAVGGISFLFTGDGRQSPSRSPSRKRPAGFQRLGYG